MFFLAIYLCMRIVYFYDINDVYMYGGFVQKGKLFVETTMYTTYIWSIFREVYNLRTSLYSS